MLQINEGITWGPMAAGPTQSILKNGRFIWDKCGNFRTENAKRAKNWCLVDLRRFGSSHSKVYGWKVLQMTESPAWSKTSYRTWAVKIKHWCIEILHVLQRVTSCYDNSPILCTPISPDSGTLCLVHSVTFPVAVCSCCYANSLQTQVASGCVKKQTVSLKEKKNTETLQDICTSISLCNILSLSGVPFSLHTRETKTENPKMDPGQRTPPIIARVCILPEDDVGLNSSGFKQTRGGKTNEDGRRRRRKNPLCTVKNILKISDKIKDLLGH